MRSGRSRLREHIRLAMAIVPTLLLGPAAAGAAGGPLFSAPFLSFDLAATPQAVQIADVNGDGKPDLIPRRQSSSRGARAGGSVRSGSSRGRSTLTSGQE